MKMAELFRQIEQKSTNFKGCVLIPRTHVLFGKSKTEILQAIGFSYQISAAELDKLSKMWKVVLCGNTFSEMHEGTKGLRRKLFEVQMQNKST